MFEKFRRRVGALRLAWHALTCPDDPAPPGTFATHARARAFLADARGMWR